MQIGWSYLHAIKASKDEMIAKIFDEIWRVSAKKNAILRNEMNVP